MALLNEIISLSLPQKSILIQAVEEELSKLTEENFMSYFDH